MTELATHTVMRELAARATLAREVRELTQRDVAERGDLGRYVVRSTERAQYAPTLSNLVRLATGLDVELRWLLARGAIEEPGHRFPGHPYVLPQEAPDRLAERMADARRYRRWTQPALVTASGCSGVPHYEAKLIEPGVPVIARLADALGCPAAWLCGDGLHRAPWT